MPAAEGTGAAGEPAARRGRVSAALAEELPGLGVAWLEVAAAPGRSPEPVRARLRELADRFYGSHAVHMRERPIPWAYRVFFRHIGLDPDETRTPVEELALRRLRQGTFRSAGLPEDALTIATIETGVAVFAFDADMLAGELRVRGAEPGESLAGRAGALEAGTLVLADERGPVAVLFGEPAADRVAGRETARIAIVALQVKGVPEIAVDEALELAASALTAA